jgi:putative ABC transport system substrate-binding protein
VQAGLALAGLGLSAGCSLLTLPWQQSTPRRIAYLSSSGLSEGIAAAWSAFRESLRDLGYVEGQNLLIEERHGDYGDRLGEPAADLVRRRMEVIVVPSITVARAVRAVTTTIPIVSAGAGDLVTGGLVASLARPGGNVTGLSTPAALVGRQLQLLKEAVPSVSRVAVLFDTGQPDGGVERDRYLDAARSLGLDVAFVGARGAEELEAAFETAARDRADGLIAVNSPLTSANQTRIGELALQHRLATIFQQSEAADRGGLLTYSPNRVDLFRRTAGYVDKILKGARPGDLPIEQPTTFDFVVNLKTARALGLIIPSSVLQQATEVIQ